MNETRLDVQVHHPGFDDLSEETRARVTFLALDAALGEVDAELWLGEVTPVEQEPLDGFGLTALRSVVHDLKRQRLDPDGLPTWLMLRGETSTGPLLAMVRSPLHPLTAPNLDTYVAVTVPYRDQADGLPGSEGAGVAPRPRAPAGRPARQRRTGGRAPQHGRRTHPAP